jgi:hypothetical protein
MKIELEQKLEFNQLLTKLVCNGLISENDWESGIKNSYLPMEVISRLKQQNKIGEATLECLILFYTHAMAENQKPQVEFSKETLALLDQNWYNGSCFFKIFSSLNLVASMNGHETFVINQQSENLIFPERTEHFGLWLIMCNYARKYEWEIVSCSVEEVVFKTRRVAF